MQIIKVLFGHKFLNLFGPNNGACLFVITE